MKIFINNSCKGTFLLHSHLTPTDMSRKMSKSPGTLSVKHVYLIIHCAVPTHGIFLHQSLEGTRSNVLKSHVTTPKLYGTSGPCEPNKNCNKERLAKRMQKKNLQQSKEARQDAH